MPGTGGRPRGRPVPRAVLTSSGSVLFAKEFDSTSLRFPARTVSIGGKGPAINSVRDMTGGGHGEPAVQPCLFILFPKGGRPSARDVRVALARGRMGQVSYDPAQSETVVVSSDWLELLVEGLTFDLLGLAPGRSLLAPVPRHCFGLSPASLLGSEAIGLAPGPHLAGAANAPPVVRTLLRLASGLAWQWEAVLGTLWLPAESAMGRGLFVSAIDAWLTGGPFPALGLTGVTERSGGVLASDGLAFFTGQELVLDAALSTDRIAATRLLVRLVDYLVEQPPLVGDRTIALEGGGRLQLAPAGSVIDVSPG